MTARVIGTHVLVTVAMLCGLIIPAGAADDTLRARQADISHIDLFPRFDAPPLRLVGLGPPVGRSRHRFKLELEGARAQAEDWLRDAGFSLLEESDVQGRRSYLVVSGVLATEWPALRFRARVGRPALSTGLRPRREAPAIGFMLPWHGYQLEFEGLEDRRLGYALMGTVRWSAPDRRLQYGIGLPIALQHGPSVGAIVQLGVRFGN